MFVADSTGTALGGMNYEAAESIASHIFGAIRCKRVAGATRVRMLSVHAYDGPACTLEVLPFDGCGKWCVWSRMWGGSRVVFFVVGMCCNPPGEELQTVTDTVEATAVE